MAWPLGLTLTTLGFVGSFLSGLLGIGGAIVVVPLLLYIPPLLGIDPLSMKAITGMTMVHVFAASLVGSWTHRAADHVDRRAVMAMGASIVIGSLAGAYGSKYLANEALTGVYAGLALLAALMMFVPRKEGDDEVHGNGPCHCALAAALAFVIGVFSGMVGAGGAFILIPIMLYVLKFPTRVAIGTSLSVVLLSAGAGLIGKLAAGQVPLVPSALLVLGALFGARFGARYSSRVNARTLRRMLTFLIAGIAVKMGWDLLA